MASKDFEDWLSSVAEKITGSSTAPKAESAKADEMDSSKTAMTCTVSATRDDRAGRFKVEGTTSGGANVKLHRLEGGCNPANAHPMPFADLTAGGSGSFSFRSTTIASPIPGVGRKVIAIATLGRQSAFGCATVVAGRV